MGYRTQLFWGMGYLEIFSVLQLWVLQLYESSLSLSLDKSKPCSNFVCSSFWCMYCGACTNNLLEEVGHPVQPIDEPFSSGNSSRVCGNSGGIFFLARVTE